MELLTPLMKLEEFPGRRGHVGQFCRPRSFQAPTEAHSKVTGEDDVQKMLIWSVSYSPFRGG